MRFSLFRLLLYVCALTNLRMLRRRAISVSLNRWSGRFTTRLYVTVSDPN